MGEGGVAAEGACEARGGIGSEMGSRRGCWRGALSVGRLSAVQRRPCAAILNLQSEISASSAQSRLAQDGRQHCLCARHRQVTDVEVLCSGVDKRAERPCQMSSAVAPSANSRVSPSTGTGRNPFRMFSVFRIGAAVVEHAKHTRQVAGATASGVEERADSWKVVMADDLRQVELGGEVLVEQEADLLFSVRVDWPSRPVRATACVPAASREAARRVRRSAAFHGLVAAKHHERRKAALARPFGIRQAILTRVLRRHERHDARPWHVVTEVGDQMSKVVFFGCADGAIGERRRCRRE